MKRAYAALLISAAIMACGCADRSATTDILNPGRVVEPETGHSKSVFINDLRLEVATIKRTFPNDEIVPIRVSVTNTGGESATLTFPTAQKNDFTAADQTGTEVWRWSTGRVFAQEVVDLKLKPGENYNYFGRIDTGVLKPGNYRISGWITADQLAGEKLSLDIQILE